MNNNNNKSARKVLKHIVCCYTRQFFTTNQLANLLLISVKIEDLGAQSMRGIVTSLFRKIKSVIFLRNVFKLGF